MLLASLTEHEAASSALRAECFFLSETLFVLRNPLTLKASFKLVGNRMVLSDFNPLLRSKE